MKLSIIIPVYNLEEYIEETLQSCLDQDISLEEYEIICVNDGSKDHSADVIQKYCNQYPNVRLYTQENAGVSAARNKGIQLAQGDYIWFVDGDDFIAKNCLSSLMSTVELNNVDIFRFRMANTSERQSIERKVDAYEICEKRENFQTFISNKSGTGGGACCEIYKTALLKENEVCFCGEIKYSEDVLFSYVAMMHASVCAKTESTLYFYYQREGSAMHSQNHAKHIQSMYLLAKEYRRLAEIELYQLWRKELKRKSFFAIKAALFSLVQQADVKEAKARIKQFKQEKLYPFPLLWRSLKGNATKKQAIINYVSFLFPWRWYFMLCVRLRALKNKKSEKKK